MSSYSYMVVPTSTRPRRSTPTRARRSRRSSTTSCAPGSRRPTSSATRRCRRTSCSAGFEQVKRIPGAVKSPSIASCNNPALNILQSAPMPDACMKVGSTCTPGTTAHHRDEPDSRCDADGGKPGATGSGGADPLGTGGGGGSGGSGDPLAGASAIRADRGPSGRPADGRPTDGDRRHRDRWRGPTRGRRPAGAGRPGRLPGRTDTVVGWLVAAMLALTVLAPPFLVARTARRRK